jgi:nucleoside-diphosphate-sugar epimerase
MHIFLTGASGFVGSAVAAALIDAGHSVTGLVRRESAVAALEAAGATAVVGDVNDPATLAAGVAKADGVIHTAFNHDFSKFRDNCADDVRVIETFGDLLAGSARPVLVTSGTGVVPLADGVVTEETRGVAGTNPRIASEQAVDAIAARGVNAGIVRLPPSVHGAGDHGFVPLLIKLARDTGRAVYTGDGGNLWPAVHRLDAAQVYRLAIERPVAPGARYHAVDETGVAFRDIATAIGRGLGVPAVSLDGAEAAAHFGWFAHFAALGNRASSTATRAALGWEPTGPGLLDDIANAGYFNG